MPGGLSGANLIANLDATHRKPPSSNSQSNRDNQWHLTAYCVFHLKTCASDFKDQEINDRIVNKR